MPFHSHQRIILITFLFAILMTKVHAGPENISHTATVMASASLNSDFDVVNVIDGKARYANIGEWASDSRMNFWGGVNYPWVQLDWDSPQTINKIVYSIGLH